MSVLNQERASRGVPPLHLSPDLVQVAQSWSDEMARTEVLRHNPRIKSEVSNWWSVGENVGMGPDLPDIENAFWNSPEHRANILDAHYTDVGIASAFRNGRLWVTVVFRQPWHHVTHHVTAQVAPVRHPRHVSTRTSERKPWSRPAAIMRVRWLFLPWAWR